MSSINPREVKFISGGKRVGIGSLFVPSDWMRVVVLAGKQFETSGRDCPRGGGKLQYVIIIIIIIIRDEEEVDEEVELINNNYIVCNNNICLDNLIFVIIIFLR